jgi:transcriptional regulator with XRE-family HTH domain
MNEDVLRGIGARLKEFRLSLHLTQEDFRVELSVKRQAVSKWEKGVCLPSGEQWYKLALMGLSLDYAILNIRSVPANRYGATARLVALPVRQPCGEASGTPERLPAS